MNRTRSRTRRKQKKLRPVKRKIDLEKLTSQLGISALLMGILVSLITGVNIAILITAGAGCLVAVTLKISERSKKEK